MDDEQINAIDWDRLWRRQQRRRHVATVARVDAIMAEWQKNAVQGTVQRQDGSRIGQGSIFGGIGAALGALAAWPPALPPSIMRGDVYNPETGAWTKREPTVPTEVGFGSQEPLLDMAARIRVECGVSVIETVSVAPDVEVGFGPRDVVRWVVVQNSTRWGPMPSEEQPATHSPEAGETIARAIQPSPYGYGLTSRWHR